MTDWGFNGWAKYRAWQRDDAMPARIAGHLKMRRFEVQVKRSDGYKPMVLEGGSIDVELDATAKDDDAWNSFHETYLQCEDEAGYQEAVRRTSGGGSS